MPRWAHVHRQIFPLLQARTTVCSLLLLVLANACSPVFVNSKRQFLSPNNKLGASDEAVGATLVYLSISGGGLRASAFSYGVIDELDQILVEKQGVAGDCATDNCSKSIMDHVTHISGVSGGAVTAAYYALSRNTEKSFLDFKEKFLYAKNEEAILRRFALAFYGSPLTDPLEKFGWRSYVAGEFFNNQLFSNAKFGSLTKPPKLLINATDLVTGKRFTFSRPQFDCLGSDLDEYPLAYAVAASASFPVAFSTVKLVNFLDRPNQCFANHELEHLRKPRNAAEENPGPERDVTSSSSRPDIIMRQRYLDHVTTQYLHLSDGGIADNLGVQAFRELLVSYVPQKINRKELNLIVVITVNAARNEPTTLGGSESGPNFVKVVSRATDLLLERATKSTQKELDQDMNSLRTVVSGTGKAVGVACISIGFADIEDDSLRATLNMIPTRFQLLPTEVDTLINAGRFVARKKASELRDILSSTTDKKKSPVSANTSCFSA